MQNTIRWNVVAGGVSIFIGFLFLFAWIGTALFFAFYAIENGDFPSFGQLLVSTPLVFFACMTLAAMMSARQLRPQETEGVIQHALILWSTTMAILAVPTLIALHQFSGLAAKGLTQAGTLIGAAGLVSEVSPRLVSKFDLFKGRIDNRIVSDRGKVQPAQTAKRIKETIKTEVQKPPIQEIVKHWIATGRGYGRKAAIIASAAMFCAGLGAAFGAFLDRRTTRRMGRRHT